MRVLVTTAPLYGHFFPLVPTAWALRAAGHEVRVATTPGFADVAAAAGLPPVPVGRDVELGGGHEPAEAGQPVGWDTNEHQATASAAGFARLAESMTDGLVAFGRAWRPRLVLHEPLAMAGPLVAAALGVPHVRHLWGVDVTHRLLPAARESLTPLLRRLGIEHDPRPPGLVLDPCPPSLQLPAAPRGLSIRYVPYNGAAVAPPWIATRPRRPRVCVTLGTVVTRTGGAGVVDRLVRTLAGLDVDVVVAVPRGCGEVLGPPAGSDPTGVGGDRIRVVESVPLDLLLPTCALVVHHGGAGTSLTSLAHGLPQLVVPRFADNFAHADQLVTAGAAVRLAADVPEHLMRAAVLELLNRPDFRRRAGRLRREIAAQPPPSAAVPALVDLVDLAG